VKILHVYKSYYPDSIGGIEKTISQLADETSRRGADCLILSLSKNPAKKVYPIGLHRGIQAKQDLFLFSTGLSLSFFHVFRRLAQWADIIHYHFPWPWMDLAGIFLGKGKKRVCTYHSDIVRQRFLLFLYWPIERAFLRSMDRIIATSENYLASSSTLNRYNRKVEVIPIGIEPFPFSNIAEDVVRNWQECLPPKFFIFIGVLRYYKGLHLLIDALAGWDAPTVIIGAGPIERRLKRQARIQGLRNLRFLGALSDQDKMAILRLSYAMVFPSHLRSEAFGISLLEGAMAGKPLISSEISTGTSYININDETGIVVKAGSSPDLRFAMERLWNDDKLSREMGTKGMERFASFFTSARMGEAYINLYRRLQMNEIGKRKW
jgi:rhamnosyl/mannosyltransferase